MPDLLARVALAKEGNDADAAHQALTVFNAAAQEHIKRVWPVKMHTNVARKWHREQAGAIWRGLQTWDSAAYTLSHLGQPSLEYFKDHNASQVIDDYLGFVNNPIASLLITGPDGLVSPSPVQSCVTLASSQDRAAEGSGKVIVSLRTQTYSPCLISTQPRGIDIHPAVIFVLPVLVDVITAGEARSCILQGDVSSQCL